MNAKKAVELGFADEILYEDKEKPEPETDPEEDDPEDSEKEKKGAPTLEAILYQGKVTDMAVLHSICDQTGPEEKSRAEPEVPMIGMDGKTKDGAMPYEILRNQLDFLK